MTTPIRERWLTALAVVAVCVFAFALRWRGLAHSLPYVTFRDSYVVYTQVGLMRTHDPEPEKQSLWGCYPHLVSRIVAALPDPEREPPPPGSTLDTDLEHASATFMQVREVSVLLSLLAVAATYGIARAFLPRGWSLFASVLVATSLLHIFFAQQEKVHGAAAGTATLAVWCAMRLRRSPTWTNIWLASIAAAAAVGALHSGAAVLIPLAVAAWLAPEPSRMKRALGALVALALVLAAVRFFYPFHFSDVPLNVDAGIGDDEGTVVLSGHQLDLKAFDGGGFRVVADTLVSFEPAVLALALVGLVALIVRASRRNASAPERTVDRGDLWVVLAYAVPYLIVIGLYRLTYERFVMPLVPFLAIVAAYGARSVIDAISRAIRAEPTRAAVRVALALVVLAPPTLLAWKLDDVRTADDTYQRAAQWLEHNARPEVDRIYVLPYLELPLLYEERALQEVAKEPHQMYWPEYQSKIAAPSRVGDKYAVLFPKDEKTTKADLGGDPLVFLAKSGIAYVVIQHVEENFRFKVIPRTRHALLDHAERVARLSPLADDDGGPAKMSIYYKRSAFERPFFVHLLNLRSEGPTLEIYRLAAAQPK
jgi:hypothetical protein